MRPFRSELGRAGGLADTYQERVLGMFVGCVVLALFGWALAMVSGVLIGRASATGAQPGAGVLLGLLSALAGGLAIDLALHASG
jgi:hypothetical protein